MSLAVFLSSPSLLRRTFVPHSVLKVLTGRRRLAILQCVVVPSNALFGFHGSLVLGRYFLVQVLLTSGDIYDVGVVLFDTPSRGEALTQGFPSRFLPRKVANSTIYSVLPNSHTVKTKLEIERVVGIGLVTGNHKIWPTADRRVSVKISE